MAEAQASPPGTPALGLRPLGIGEQLDVALKICTTHWRALVKAIMLPVVPAALLITLLSVSTLPEGANGEDLIFGTDPGEATGDDFAALVGGQVAGALIGIVVSLLVFGACFRLVAEAYLGAGPDWRESLRYAARRAPALLWLSVLFTLGLVVGFVLLIIPAIFLSVAWALSYPTLFAEDVRGAKALGRSRRLVKGRWWATAAVLGIGYAIATILALAGTLAFGALVFVDADSIAVGVVVSIISNIAGQAISAPIIASVLAVTYFDLRVRKEGLDLELLARGIGTEREPATRSPAERPTPLPASGAAPPPYWPPPPGWSPEPDPGPAADAARWGPPTPPPDASTGFRAPLVDRDRESPPSDRAPGDPA